jgi:hypothetical protein
MHFGPLPYYVLQFRNHYVTKQAKLSYYEHGLYEACCTASKTMKELIADLACVWFHGFDVLEE